MPEKKGRWRKESGEFLDALISGMTIEPGKTGGGKGPSDDPDRDRKRQALDTERYRKGGRPRLDSPATDKLVPYNFKLKESELEAVRRLAEDNTRTIRSLMSEAIADLLRKYGDKGTQK